VVHELGARLKAKGMHLFVAAYTGIAPAPFGGPALPSLLNPSPSAQKQKRVKGLSRSQIEETKKKFKAESGMDNEHVGGIVTDEAVFIEAGLLGQADGTSRQCTGKDAAFGGTPMLLAGENMQKEPPNSQGGPWYRGLVGRATGGPFKIRTGIAEAKGTGLLAGMPL